MKFTCLQENLLKGLSIVYKAVPVKSSLPILSNVLIATENGRLKLSAFNMETAISTYIGASIEEDGSTTVPARLLKEFISTISPSTINISLTNDILHMQSDKTRSRLNTVSSADFPPLPSFSSDKTCVELDPKQFADLINLVAFSAANDETRPVFSGVYLNFDNGVLTAAAADGYRLSENTLSTQANVKNFTAIIPSKTILEIARIFSTSNEILKMSLNQNENLALFLSEDTLVATRVLNGEYPNYKKIIPTQSSLKASFSADEFLEAVRLTSLFTKDAGSAVKIKIDPTGFLEVTSSAQESGEHQSKIPAEIEGEGLEIAFNSRYLLDYLSNTKPQRIQIHTNGPSSPSMFLSADHSGYIHIIAPMQIQG